MKKYGKAVMVLGLGATALWACGCGTKKMATTEVPKEPNETAQVEKAEPAGLEKYTVKEGDTLWAISDQSRNYSDSFQWPLIFKTNRDQIQDPDQISPGQVLMIQRGHSADQTKRARQLASDTPKFIHHDEPRTTLPVDYF
jgi:Tfp pilus assembly protein FimV